MSHERKRKATLKIEKIDEMAKVFGWTLLKANPRERVYWKTNLEVRFVKVKDGYKTLMYTDGILKNTDIDTNKNIALTMLGETLSFREW